MRLAAIGLSHRTASIEVRERFAHQTADLCAALDQLKALELVEEACIVSTCNRVEFYVAGHAEPTALVRALRGHLLGLAGLPPEMGLYASILPLIVYALFGTSRQLAVGPVAILSLMTAAAASRIAEPGSPAYVEAALILAFLSGGMLLVFGLLRMGFLANFLSHPVVSGFITASVVDPFGNILGLMANPHYLEILNAIKGA